MLNIKIEVVDSEKQIKDVERLAKIIWTEHYMPIIGPDQIKYMLEKYQSYSAISSSIANGFIYYLVTADGEPCGYSAFTYEKGVFLSKFYVEKTYRGLGIGKKMLLKIIETAAFNNQSRIWLTCNKFNERTLEAYKKMGFKTIDSVVTDIGNGFVMDDYVLEKNI